jgi:multidrug efflux pump subunit AcrB
VENWLVEPVEIDDVPIVTMTLFSQGKPPYQLRRLAEEFKARLDSLRDISRTEIYGGYKREILIEPDPEKMATGKISFMDIENALRAWNSINTAGDLYLKGKKIRLVTSPGLSNAEDIANTVVKTFKDRIVKIEDIATVKDAPAEQESYVNTGFGPVSPYSGEYGDKVFPAVTLAFSKKRGTNAVAVAENIIKKARELRKSLFPKNVELLITRNYGESADEKVNDLISGMIFAVLTVIVLITITMGWREGLVVGLAVPISFSLALFVNYVSGYTINRVTLFALILSLGLVVDDPITNVDNIQRHIKTGLSSPFMATIEAVREVLPPVIMSTLAIIISFTPMFFITGMMGPYMGPMAVNVPLAVTFSTLCALTFVPWLSYNLLKKQPPDTHVNADKKGISPAMKKIYSAVITPFLSKKGALILLASVII